MQLQASTSPSLTGQTVAPRTSSQTVACLRKTSWPAASRAMHSSTERSTGLAPRGGLPSTSLERQRFTSSVNFFINSVWDSFTMTKSKSPSSSSSRPVSSSSAVWRMWPSASLSTSPPSSPSPPATCMSPSKEKMQGSLSSSSSLSDPTLWPLSSRAVVLEPSELHFFSLGAAGSAKGVGSQCAAVGPGFGARGGSQRRVFTGEKAPGQDEDSAVTAAPL
mmetsp:Transcript_16514/g.34904  ORF Transcript_16514/g.34904 Transcript_16514/m.34904 type:complete len:220 (-) Transcript_16514:102-761(-)